VQKINNCAENNLPSRAQVKPFDVTADGEDETLKRMGTEIGAARKKSRFPRVNQALFPLGDVRTRARLSF
jgi:hypothetical protein